MKDILLKFKKIKLQINTIVTLVFIASVALMYTGFIKPIEAYHIIVFSLLCVFSYLLYELVKNKFIFIDSKKFLLFSFMGILVLLFYITMILLSLFVLFDGLVN